MAAAASTIPTEQQLPSDALYIFTDLETESIQANTLLQIAAVSITGEQFNTFINPQCPLTEDCSNLLGLFYFNGDLYRDGRRLFSKNIKTALLEFMLWLSNFNKPIVLVFHNGFSFDCKVLSKFLVQFNILVPENLTFVADTLPYIRINLKEIENHKLGTLAEHFKIKHDLAHDALSDSLTLMLICNQIVAQSEITHQTIFKDSWRHFSDYLNLYRHGQPVKPLKKRKRTKKSTTKSTKLTETKNDIDKTIVK